MYEYVCMYVVSITIEWEVICVLLNTDVAGDLGWPLTKQTSPVSTFCIAFLIFVVSEFRDFKFRECWS